jgi:hypothetical protein
VIEQLVSLLPPLAGTAATLLCAAGAAGGLTLWALGARIGNGITTLLGVAAGGLIGLHVPDWLGWSISGSATALGGALLLGAAGWFAARVFMGAIFGSALAAWAGVLTWIGFSGGVAFAWPEFRPDQTWYAYFAAVWHLLPADVARLLPYAMGSAMIMGVSLALLWPRALAPLAWSVAGLSLATVLGLTLAVENHLNWRLVTPTPAWGQAMALAILVGMGAVLQMQTRPRAVAGKDADSGDGR